MDRKGAGGGSSSHTQQAPAMRSPAVAARYRESKGQGEGAEACYRESSNGVKPREQEFR
jgi:hypothetical protein